MLKEFKEFALRGNVLDMAVGIILGAAFGKIVTSLVNDMVMPPIGLAFGRVDFSSLFINLSGQSYATLKDAKAAGAAVISYGTFITHDQGVWLLLVDHPREGDPMPPLHVPAVSGVTRADSFWRHSVDAGGRLSLPGGELPTNRGEFPWRSPSSGICGPRSGSSRRCLT